MTTDIKAFRAQLKASGEPWQQRGIRVVWAGFAALVLAYMIPIFVNHAVYPLTALVTAVVLLAIGWSMLVVAFFRRRRWAKDHASELVIPELPNQP